MSDRVPYARIPQTMRDLLDEVLYPDGVEMWWNARHKPLDGWRPATLWQDAEGRQRVIRWSDTRPSGAW